MAERRMFAKTIIDSDVFLDMPLSAQALYFHLSMRADDDGFINNPKKIQRMIGASNDDCRLLILKRFIITFDSGVIVIKHWKIHNYIQRDRYKPTLYQKEKSMLSVNDNKSYTECIQDVSTTDTQVRLGESSLVKSSLGKGKETTPLPAPDEYKEITELFNSICTSLPPIKVISESMRSNIKKFKAAYNSDEIKEIFERAEASDFLKGRNHRNWKATFDWIIQPEHSAKVLNGNYNDSKNQSSYDMKGFMEKAEKLPVYKSPKTVAEEDE